MHAEHVDEKAERAQVAGEPVEDAGCFRVDRTRDHLLDLVAHVRQRGGRVVHAEQGQHAAHRSHLAGHRHQHGAFVRTPEELVDQAFGFGQRGAQFLHHAAHGLAVCDAPVQLLGPGFERLGRAAVTRGVQPLDETQHARRLLGRVEIGTFQRRFDIQQAGRDFHRELGRRRDAGLRERGHGALEFGAESLAVRKQALERFTDQRDLLDQAGQAVRFAAGQRRPAFLGRSDALARLRDPGRVEAPEHVGRIVGRRVVGEAIGLAHRREARRCTSVARRRALRAEEEQVLREARRDRAVAALERAKLSEQARGDALAEDVEAEQPLVLRLEHGGGELPQRRVLGRRGTCAQAGADLAHAARAALRLRAAHQLEQLAFEFEAGRRIDATRRDTGVGRQVAPLPVVRPQVGGVDAFGARCLLQGAIGGKELERRDRLAGEQPAEVVEQGKRCTLDVLDQRHGKQRRLGDAALHRRHARAQHEGLGRQADQFERAGALMQLDAGGAQHCRVDRIDIRAVERLRIAQEAAQGLVRRIERAPQFVLDPGQRTQIVGRRRQRIGQVGDVQGA